MKPLKCHYHCTYGDCMMSQLYGTLDDSSIPDEFVCGFFIFGRVFWISGYGQVLGLNIPGFRPMDKKVH